MTVGELLGLLARSPVVASVQSHPGCPVEHDETLLRLAQASLAEGVKVLRMQGPSVIELVQRRTDAVVIGLVKKHFDDSPVYITPTLAEVDALLAVGCPVIGLDGTPRPRPGGVTFGELVARCKSVGALVLADVDSVESAQYAVSEGADIVSTTLAGYTGGDVPSGPDLELVRDLLDVMTVPVLAEGRYSEGWHVTAAMRAGVAGVVIGAALNDPVKLTQRFLLAASPTPRGRTVAFDIGGTWLRAATLEGGIRSELTDLVRMPLPPSHEERLAWMRVEASRRNADRVGVSTGGQVWRGEVVDANQTIPGYVGSRFDFGDRPAVVLNDGSAAAWAHACDRPFVGKRVLTLVLGSGVGAGFVAEMRLRTGPRGDYLRLNALVTPQGGTVEERAGGLALGPDPDREARAGAVAAVAYAVEVARNMLQPDVLVLAGGLGGEPWMQDGLAEACSIPIVHSMFGEYAGLRGAAALALYPPPGLDT